MAKNTSIILLTTLLPLLGGSMVTLLIALILSGCDVAPDPEVGPKLSRQTAEDVLTKRVNGVLTCIWYNAHPLGAKELSYLPSKTGDPCLEQLIAAKLLVKDRCIKKGCPSGCCSWAVEADGIARIDGARPGSLKFPCGSQKVGEVLSIATDGNDAAVRYTIVVQHDELVKKLDKCSITVPKEETAKWSKTLTRDDEGAWH